jgi:hypothetical protein
LRAVSDRKKPATEPPSVGAAPLVRTLPPDRSGLARHPIGTPGGLSPGALAIAAWLSDRGIFAPAGKPWRIDVTLDATTHSPTRVFAESIDTRFHLRVCEAEWAYYFCHAGRATKVRVTDLPRVDGADDHGLVTATPPLRRIGKLVRQIEQRYAVLLPRTSAVVESTLQSIEPIVRAWVLTL